MNRPGEHSSPTGRTNPGGKVGYGYPPVEHRFKKGVSGNPKGRPKKAVHATGDMQSDYFDAVTRVANEKVALTNKNGRTRKVTSVEALLRVARQKGMQGDKEALRIFLHHAGKVEQSRRRERQRRYDQQVEYKRRSAAELRRCEATGLEPPDPVPHPDDMQVDCVQELVHINGPADDVEKVEWDESETEREDLNEFIAHLRDVLTGPEEGLMEYSGSRKLVLELLEETKAELATLDALYPPKEQRRRSSCVHRRSHDQEGRNAGLSAIRRTDNLAHTTREETPTKLPMQRDLKQCDEMLAHLDQQLISNGDPTKPLSSIPIHNVTQAEWDASETERRATQGEIRYFEEELTKSDEELATAGWSREIVSAHLKTDQEELATLNAFYPPLATRCQPGFDLGRWRKEKAKGREPPRLWLHS